MTAEPNEQKKEKKVPKEGLVIPPKKPKPSKAERRALQEAQRAAKGLNSDGNAKANVDDKSITNHNEKNLQQDVAVAIHDKKQSSEKPVGSGDDDKSLDRDKTPNFFSHLPTFIDYASNKNFCGMQLGSTFTSMNNTNLHPAVLALGLQYADMSIRGANARCKAMLRTFQTVIRDHEFAVDSKDFRQDLENKILKPAFTYWTTQCRPHSVTMGNAFTFLKLAVANLDRDMNIDEVKEELCDSIEAYIQERIEFADKAICKHAAKKIVDGDVILTYAKNEVIQQILTFAKTNLDKKFRVIVVDSRPMLDGKDMLETLNKADIECTYIMFNAVSYVMKEVSKVFIGASALMSDGSVFSRVGTAGVALMAKNYNVPVLVCTETYKISYRVQMESITGNELGNPNELISNSCTIGSDSTILHNWRNEPNLRLLNPLFDLTPSEFVSGIVTELGILPPTSVAVLLREMNPQHGSLSLEDIVE